MSNFNIDPAFEHKIITALANSINPNNEERKAAEASLTEARRTPGYASALLKISADKSLATQQNVDISHAASIQFGRLVEVHWKFKDEQHAQEVAGGIDYIVLNEEDKKCVRENLMRAVFEQVTNKPIIKQYTRSLKKICERDFPQSLPNLFGQIMGYLNEQNQQSIYAGLLGLQTLASRYEFELDEEREPLFEIIRSSFERLGLLVNDMINHQDNIDALHMMHLVCKVFYTCNQLQMCPYLMESNHLNPWMQFFKTIIDLPLPEALSAISTDPDEIQQKNKEIHWKIKGVACKVTYKIFMKYANTSIVEDKPHIKDFSKRFVEQHALPLLESHLQLFLRTKTNFVGSKALFFAIKFISTATKLEYTMTKLKPFVEQILCDTIVPLFYVTLGDLQTFENDPIEFIRNQYDFTRTMFKPKVQSQDLLGYLCKYSSEPKNKKHRKPDYLHKFLEFVIKNLDQYHEQLAAGQQVDWRIKEGLLFAVGSLRDEIEREKDLKGQLERIMQTYVLAEL